MGLSLLLCESVNTITASPCSDITGVHMEDESEFVPGKPEYLDSIELEIDHVDEPKRNKIGRPRGSLNKGNKGKVFRSQMEAHFEKVLRKDFQYILKNTVEKAIEGDMQATKMLMDRVIPVGKAVDLADNKGTPQININIGSLVKELKEDKDVVSEQ